MQTYGNLTGLKGSIEKKYGAEIKRIEKETKERIGQIKRELDSRLMQKKLRAKTTLEAEEKKAYSKILSEEKLRAKRSFEQEREAMITDVFNDVEKRIKDVVKAKQYKDWVSKQSKTVPKSAKKKETGTGTIFSAGDVSYDFTLDGAIRSRKDIVRHIISTRLFS